MINNIERIGNPTSSNAFKLLGAPKPKATYLAEKNLERRLNRSIETDAYSPAIAWGNFLEERVNNLLGMEYQLCSNKTDVHPTIKCWVGSKDFIVKGVKIAELKCYELKNFAAYTDCLVTRDSEKVKAEFPKEYWQGVSNALINEVPVWEAITYCPYKSELVEIREMALDYRDADAWKYRFIYERSPEGLPHLEDGGYYKNLNKFEFEIPEEDALLITNAMRDAEKDLTPFYVKGQN